MHQVFLYKLTRHDIDEILPSASHHNDQGTVHCMLCVGCGRWTPGIIVLFLVCSGYDLGTIPKGIIHKVMVVTTIHSNIDLR